MSWYRLLGLESEATIRPDGGRCGLRIILLLLAFRLGSGIVADGTEPVRAGAARIELTPPMEMKAALGGYGARMSRAAEGVHDAVWAKVLVVQGGGRRLALVTADVLAFPPKLKRVVVDRLAAEGWEAEQILLLPSHTHASIDMMALHPDNTFGIPQVGIFQGELLDWVTARIAQAIREASQRLAPAVAGTAVLAVAERNRNRRGGGAVDRDLTVTRIDAVDGRPIAVMVNWTAHPTFMDAEDMLFSGGWPGHLQRTLEALIGHDVVGLFYNGAEGDQSPIPPPHARSQWERAERYGRELGIAAWRTYEQITPKPVSAFEVSVATVALPKGSWHPDFLKTGGAEYGLNEAMMQGFVDRLLPRETHCTGFRFGDLLLVGVPGEMSAELGLELKARLRQADPEAVVTIGGLADEWISYILSAAEYRRGGYEASMSYYGEQLGMMIVEGGMRAAGP